MAKQHRQGSGIWLLLVAAVALAAGCQSLGGGDGRPPILEEPYDGPAVTVDVLQQRMIDPPQFVAVVEVVTPTGGWAVSLDEGIVDAEHETAELFLTLQSPSRHEMVTQALVAHHVTFRSEQPFSETAVFVRQHVRGEGRPAGYRPAGQ